MLAVLLAVLATSVADAKPGLKPFVPGPVRSALVMGGGYVGVQPVGKPFLVINEATERVVNADVPSGCFGNGLHYPWLGLLCAEGPRVLNLDTGELRSVPGPPLGGPYALCGEPPSFSAFGLYWIAGSCNVHNEVFTGVFLNWRTGAVRYQGGGSLGFDAPTTQVYDIDSPNLDAHDALRCRGLPQAYLARPKWVVYRRKASPTLRLRRCRGGKSIVLSDSNTAFGIAGKRAAAWIAATKIGLYMTDSGRRYRWNVPRTDFNGGPVQIQLSDRYLYVTVPTTDGWSRLYRAALPKRVAAARSASR